MKNIGGFFEIEIAEGETLYHDESVGLSTGRACLSLVLDLKNYSKVYLPFYCCDALFEPLELKGVDFEFYRIDEQFEILDEITLQESEAIVYCNFFGIKTAYVNKLIGIYGHQLIIDDSHSFFKKGYENNISFVTARKYFGVPDGAFLYLPTEVNLNLIPRKKTISINHGLHRLIGLQDAAFREFQEYENSLGSSIERISLFSEKVLKTIDYEKVKNVRNNNFMIYRKNLDSINSIKIDNDAVDCFCYPLLLEKPIDKKLLYDKGIFIPVYWTDVLNRKKEYSNNIECFNEMKFSKEILPLPIDHRYDSNDIERVIETIKKITDG